MPGNKYKKYWDFLIIYHLVYTALATPVRVAFEEKSTDFWFIYDCWMDSCFIVDIFMTFLTALVVQKGGVITDLKVIAHTYLKLWFWIDLVTSIPFQIYDRTVEIQLDGSSSLTNIKVLRVSKLLKIIRMIRLLKVFNFTKKLMQIQQNTGDSVKNKSG
jgi:hypothetical protein